MATLVSKVPLVRTSFEWRDIISPDGLLCKKNLELHCENGEFYHFSFEMKHLPHKPISEKDHKNVEIKLKLNKPIEKLSFAVVIKKQDRKQNWSTALSVPLTMAVVRSNEEDSRWTCFAPNLQAQDINSPTSVILSIEIHPLEPKPVDHEPSLAQLIQNLYLNEEQSDIKIVCDDEEFPCHKFILSSRSDVFQVMFSTKESREELDGILKIDDISAQTMRTFLKFMYKDALDKEDIDPNLLIAAEKYNVKRLKNICTRQLLQSISTTNVMEIVVAAYLINDDFLLQKGSEFIFNNRGTIKKCAEWDDVKTRHPGIATKVMDLIVFDDKAE